MQYGNNNTLVIGAQYFPQKDKWERYILLSNIKTDSLEYDIIFDEEVFDSLIYKMDKIRSEIL